MIFTFLLLLLLLLHILFILDFPSKFNVNAKPFHIHQNACVDVIQAQNLKQDIYIKIYQLNIEKAWCMRRLRETGNGISECMVIETQFATQLHTLFDIFNENGYLKSANHYFHNIAKFLTNPHNKEIYKSMYDAVNQMALYIYDINPILIGRGDIVNTLHKEVDFLISPSDIDMYLAMREALLKKTMLILQLVDI